MVRPAHIYTFIPCNLLTLPIYTYNISSHIFSLLTLMLFIGGVFVVFVTFSKCFDGKHVNTVSLNVANDCVMEGAHGVEEKRRQLSTSEWQNINLKTKMQ